MKHFDVAVFEEGASEHNTLVLGGAHIVVPLEMDIDDDPMQDDEVRLVAQHGHWEQHVRASDRDAEAKVEERVILYHFRDVPPGIYDVEVNVAGGWRKVMRGLRSERKPNGALKSERKATKLGAGVRGVRGGDDV
jgi:hypothetical protein